MEAYPDRCSEMQESHFLLMEKHSIMMNPFIEYLRAAMEMAVQGFSYESVFRYLRCGMSDITREEADLLENYVIALGIRGVKQIGKKNGFVFTEVWSRKP